MTDASRFGDQRLTNQDDVDALFEGRPDQNSRRDSGEDRCTGAECPGHTLVVSALRPLNEQFARCLGTRADQMLPVPVTLASREARVLEFSRFMDGIRLPSSLHVVAAEPAHAPALVVLEPDMLLRLARLYSGNVRWGGQPKIEGREFTAEETAAARTFLDCALPELDNAWAPLGPFHFRHQRAEQDPWALKTFSRKEWVVHSPFELALGEYVGMLHIVVSLAMLSPALSFAYENPDQGKECMAIPGQNRTMPDAQATEKPNFDNDKAPERP